MDEMCIHAKITGEVQGVFFRDSARQKADSLGVTGWVRNVEDGSVELIACGDKSQIDAFIDWLQEGPPMATVSQLDYEEIAWQDFSEFSVVR